MDRNRRSVVTVLLLLVVMAGSSLAPCAGWDSSAKARMACCAGAKHECSQVRADDCCAAGEQRQHSETFDYAAQALVPSHGAVLPIVDALAVARPSGCVFSRTDRPLGSPPDTHLLLSVFLI